MLDLYDVWSDYIWTTKFLKNCLAIYLYDQVSIMSTKDSQQANYSYLATLAIQFIVNGSMDVSRAEWANINLTVGFQALSTS